MDRGELGTFLFTAERFERDHAALAVLLGLNGLRISEACATNIEDLGFRRGHRTLHIVGKGNKPALIPLVRACLFGRRSNRLDQRERRLNAGISPRSLPGRTGPVPRRIPNRGGIPARYALRRQGEDTHLRAYAPEPSSNAISRYKRRRLSPSGDAEQRPFECVPSRSSAANRSFQGVLTAMILG